MRPATPLRALALALALAACERAHPGGADADAGARADAGTGARADAGAGARADAGADAGTRAAAAAAAQADPRCPEGWACDPDAFDRAPRPQVTQILVQKRAHRLFLISVDTIVKSYGVALGSGGLGQKRYEGDRVTPIGTYTITGRYPSRWHTYLALSYPNADDWKRFDTLVERGEVDKRRGPGSGIAIHGRRADMPDGLHKLIDWTLGCVALDNAEIDEVAAAVPVGTRVVIEE